MNSRDALAQVSALIEWEKANRPGAMHTIRVNVTIDQLCKMCGVPTRNAVGKTLVYQGRALEAVGR